jgi:hypothetical protein
VRWLFLKKYLIRGARMIGITCLPAMPAPYDAILMRVTKINARLRGDARVTLGA